MSAPVQLDAEAQDPQTKLVIGAVAVTLLLASLGQTIVSTALPTIVGQLGGLDHLTWVVIIGSFVWLGVLFVLTFADYFSRGLSMT